jgi:DNA-binding NtrC family response regulator
MYIAVRSMILRRASLRRSVSEYSEHNNDGDAGRERRIVEAALAETRGRVSGPDGAAAKLRLPPSTLDGKINELNIRKSNFNSAKEHTESWESRFWGNADDG